MQVKRRRTGSTTTTFAAVMWLIRYAAGLMALAAVLGGMSPAPVAAANTSVWQLRRHITSVEDPEVPLQFEFEIWVVSIIMSAQIWQGPGPLRASAR